MNKLLRFWGSFGVLAVPALLLSLSVPAFAADQTTKVGTQQNKSTEVQLSKEVRHQLLMLPYYSVFDNLEFQIKDDNTVVLLGEVVRPTLKSDAGATVKGILGVKKVINDIKVLPLSPFDNSIRRAEFRAIYRAIGFEKYAIQAVPPIHIIVKNGDVTLVGVVASKGDKELAGIEANEVPYVFKVTNDLRVEHNG